MEGLKSMDIADRILLVTELARMARSERERMAELETIKKRVDLVVLLLEFLARNLLSICKRVLAGDFPLSDNQNGG